MANLNFPTNPSNGDTYEGYVYNAAKGVWQWQVVDPSVVSLVDTNIENPAAGEVLEYDGAEWVNATSAAAGGLVAVKSALKTDAESFTNVAAGGNVAVPELSITHEVSDPANKLIISAFFGVAANSNGYANTGIAIHDGTGLIAVGDTAGSRTSLAAGGFVSASSASFITSFPSVTFVHTPGAGSKTYTVRAVNIDNATGTVFINRTEDDNDDVGYSRAVSSLVIQEVAV